MKKEAKKLVEKAVRKNGGSITEKVEAALKKVRPFLQSDGGDVKLVEVTADGIVKIKLLFACDGCPMASITFKNGIERVIKEEVPEVQSVEMV